MLDVPRLISNIEQQIGWRQPIDTENAIVDAFNNTSNSGKFFQDYSKAVRIENLRTSWPLLNDADFNTKLKQETEESIVRASYAAVNGAADLIETKPLFHFENDFLNKVPNVTDKFVGFELQLKKKEGVAIKLNKIMSQFDGIVSPLKLYVYHSTQKTAIFTIDITTQVDSVKTQNNDTTLYYQNDLYVGGTFYIGYYQNDLGSTQAYNREFERADIQNRYECISMRSISVINSGIELFDINDIVNESETWGLNFDISIYKDWTQLIIDNITVIEDLLGYQTVSMFINSMLYNNRNNDFQKANQDRFLIELKGLSGAKELGIETILQKELERVQQIFFPRHLITITTVN